MNKILSIFGIKIIRVFRSFNFGNKEFFYPLRQETLEEKERGKNLSIFDSENKRLPFYFHGEEQRNFLMRVLNEFKRK